MKQPSKPKLLLICKNFFVQANNLALLGDDFSVMKAVFFMDYAIEQMLNILIMDFGSDEDFKNHEIKWNTLWQKVTKAIKDETSIKMNRIPNYKQLKELRDIRNGLQHNGTIPRADQVSRLVNPAKEILSECFSKCYGFDLDNFRLWDVVQNVQLRRLLIESEEALKQLKKPIVCLTGCKIAFDKITSAIRARMPSHSYWLLL